MTKDAKEFIEDDVQRIVTDIDAGAERRKIRDHVTALKHIVTSDVFEQRYSPDTASVPGQAVYNAASPLKREAGQQEYNDLDTLLTKLSDVEETPKAYIYAPYIQIGKLTEVAAEPGTGKTKLVDCIAARITSGQSLCGIPCERPGSVLLFSAEDDAVDHRMTIASCGGDLSMVVVLAESDCALDRLSKSPLTFASPVVEAAIRKYSPSLVVFDPMQRYSGKCDLNSQADTTVALTPLVKLARKYDTAILLVAHNGKGHTSLQAKASGSTNIIGMMRSALSVVIDPENPAQNLAIHTKTNNARGKAIRFQIKSIENNPSFATVDLIGLEDYSERDYRKALANAERERGEAEISNDEPVVKTVLQLASENPGELRIGYKDFEKAYRAVNQEEMSGSPAALCKKYGPWLSQRHNLTMFTEFAQPIKPFKFMGNEEQPVKSPDRVIKINHKKPH